jgi:hypothetical protein
LAPFLSHLVIGERVWLRLGAAAERQACGEASQFIQGFPLSAASVRDDREWFGDQDYGAFLFGCLAPDVDKFCDGLEQSTTHFLPKDGKNRFAWRRSARFLENTREYLHRPFCRLAAYEQAFVVGYLCHVAADEITARHAIGLNKEMEAGGAPLPPVDSVLTAMDPRVWALALSSEGLVAALSEAPIPSGTLTFATKDCLAAMHQIVLPQVREGGGLVPYLSMVRRQWIWMRHGKGVDNAGNDPSLEVDLNGYRRRIEAGMPASERLMDSVDLEAFVEEAVVHSCQRIGLLLNQECGG